MPLSHLRVNHFRNLISVTLNPLLHGFNIIYGNNGSGKTSLLEAIYYVGRGRSFRTSLYNRLITQNEKELILFGELKPHNQSIRSIGIEKNLKGETQIRLDRQPINSIAEMVHLFPLQVIHSHSHTLLETPHFRRKYLDWGIFYSSDIFLSIWRRFYKALKQRNSALREQRSRQELKVWTQEVAEIGEILDKMRRSYIENLVPQLEPIVHEILGHHDLKINYQKGWAGEGPYSEFLFQSLDKDYQAAHTQFGPHRADFKLQIKGVPAKDILSRGQQKLIVCAMIIAQGTLLNNDMNIKPIYLVDDLPSELDAVSRSKLLSLLSRQNTQIFITAVEPHFAKDVFKNYPMKMFHVEHGALAEIKDQDLLFT